MVPDFENQLTGVCFTGHRSLSEKEKDTVMRRLDILVRFLTERCGTKYFYNGGALGFDTAAAHTVIGIKGNRPDVMLELYLPCRGQDSGWKPQDRAIYKNIIRHADHAIVFSPVYTPDCMLARDRAMVDASDLCVCYMCPGRFSGGTAYTVRYARKNCVPVLNLFSVTEEDLLSSEDREDLLALTEK